MSHIHSNVWVTLSIAVPAAALAVLVAACEDRSPSTQGSTPAAPDNTKTNVRDRSAANSTPMDQGESESDRTITAEIRKAIMADRGMSINAQNCKVITKNGVVTLRGPVETQGERDAIEAKAKAVAGVTSVTNELEATPKN